MRFYNRHVCNDGMRYFTMTQNMSKTLKDSETTKNTTTTATTKKKKKKKKKKKNNNNNNNNNNSNNNNNNSNNNNCIKEEEKEEHKKPVALCVWQEVRFQSLLRPWPLLQVPVVLCPVPRF